MRRLQTGGYVQFNPLPVEVPIYNSQPIQVNPAMYAPIPDTQQPKIEAPDYSEMFKDVDGYTNEKKEVVGKAYEAYTRLKEYLGENQYNYNTDYAKRLIKEMTIDPVKKEELKNNWKLGREAEKSITTNKSESQWARDDKNNVLMTDGTAYKWMSDIEATQLSISTGLNPVSVGELVGARNNAEDLKWDNNAHTAMRSTVGQDVLREYIEKLKADGGKENKWDFENLDSNLGKLSVSGQQLAIIGVRGYGGEDSSNVAAYHLATQTAYEQVSNDKGLNGALRSQILQKIKNGQMTLTPETLVKAGIIEDETQLIEIYTDKEKLNKVIEMESKLYVANQLHRHMKTTTNRTTSVSPMQWLTDQGSGSGEYKKALIDFWGATSYDKNLIDWKSATIPLPGNTDGMNVLVTQIPATAMDGINNFNGSNVESFGKASVVFNGVRINEEMIGAGLGTKNVIMVSNGPNGTAELIKHYDINNADYKALDNMEKQFNELAKKKHDPNAAKNIAKMIEDITIAKEFFSKTYIRGKMYVNPAAVNDLKAFKLKDERMIIGVFNGSVDPRMSNKITIHERSATPPEIASKIDEVGFENNNIGVIDVELEKLNSGFEDPTNARQEYNPEYRRMLLTKAQQALLFYSKMQGTTKIPK